jgi:ferric-dicitrate binding protein FerR (iron transport regulator)
MTQEEFHDLLKRYKKEQCTPEEKKLLEQWYASIGETDASMAEIADASGLEKRYWDKISRHVSETKDAVPGKKGRSVFIAAWPSAAIAAAVSLFLIAFAFWIVRSKTEVTNLATDPVTMKEMVNTEPTPKEVYLPDGSHITLQPKSRIIFSGAFDETQRQVFLEGEAFFEVAHDKERPFLVHAQQLTTRVLGTSFIVKAFPNDKDITVMVRTGKVSVYTKPESDESATNETILTPNQQIVYNKDENTSVRTLVESPRAMVPEEDVKHMHFEGAPVTSILQTLEKVYQVDIVFDEDLFSACTLTTSISGGGIYNRLDIICTAIGATYKVEGTTIVIEGTGCDK